MITIKNKIQHKEKEDPKPFKHQIQINQQHSQEVPNGGFNSNSVKNQFLQQLHQSATNFHKEVFTTPQNKKPPKKAPLEGSQLLKKQKQKTKAESPMKIDKKSKLKRQSNSVHQASKKKSTIQLNQNTLQKLKESINLLTNKSQTNRKPTSANSEILQKINNIKKKKKIKKDDIDKEPEQKKDNLKVNIKVNMNNNNINNNNININNNNININNNNINIDTVKNNKLSIKSNKHSSREKDSKNINNMIKDLKGKENNEIKNKVVKGVNNKESTKKTKKKDQPYDLQQKFNSIFEKIMEKNSNLSSPDPNRHEQNLNYVNKMAILIQKVWRGYKARKLINEYYKLWLQSQEQEKPQTQTQQTKFKNLKKELHKKCKEKIQQKQLDLLRRLKNEIENMMEFNKDNVLELLREQIYVLEDGKQKKKPILQINIEEGNVEKNKGREVEISENIVKQMQKSNPNTPQGRSRVTDNDKKSQNLFDKETFGEFKDNFFKKTDDKKIFVEQNLDNDIQESLSLKPKNLVDKWVIPNITPSKTPKQISFPQLQNDKQTERSLSLITKVNNLKEQQSASNKLIQLYEDPQSQQNPFQQSQGQESDNADLDCEETIFENKIVVNPNNFLKIQRKSKLASSLTIQIVSDNLIQHLILEALNELNSSNRQEIVQIDPGFDAINQFLNEICSKIFKENINEFLDEINKPKDSDQVQKLRNLQNNQLGTLNKQDLLQNQIFYEQEARKDNHIFITFHNKLIFDCLKEALEYFRPFDIRGKSLQWKTNEKKLTYQTITDQNIPIVFEQAKHKVLEASSYFCGFLNEPRSYAPQVIDPIYLPQLCNEKIERIILNDIYEQNETWLDYHDDETVVQIEISNLIFQDLIQELLQELQQDS